MKTLSIIALSVVAALPAVAEETRQLDSHEHGVGQLDIAFDGSQVAMEFHAPGADIVGFEYEAESAEDLASIEKALGVLAKPLDLFAFSQAAGCRVVETYAELEAEDSHDDHDEHSDDREEKDHDDHKDHEDEHHDDHAEHEEKDHDDHDHDKHETHADDGHDEHADETGHKEFHAEYLLNCSNTNALGSIAFTYFESFPNAVEVEVQIITDTGATSFEIERDAPVLDLSDLF